MKGDGENENSSKKSTKVFKRICKINIWDKRLNELHRK